MTIQETAAVTLVAVSFAMLMAWIYRRLNRQTDKAIVVPPRRHRMVRIVGNVAATLICVILVEQVRTVMVIGTAAALVIVLWGWLIHDIKNAPP